MKTIIQITGLIILVVLLTSCDGEVQYRFQITNHTEQKIKVDYTASGRDSVVEILPGKTVEIYKLSTVGAYGEDYCHNGMGMIQRIHLTPDFAKNEDSLLQRKAWKLDWNDNYEGIYTLNINP